MSNFISLNKVPGAALAVSHAGRLVYAKGFGYADLKLNSRVSPLSLFRIGSVSKLFTAHAIFRLISEGKINLSSRMLELLAKEASLIGPINDRRLYEIKIVDLLQHLAGWDRDISGDYTHWAAEAIKRFGQDQPLTKEGLIRYGLSRMLDFDPGSRQAYSNFGYILLGKIIEIVSGMPYERYVREHVLLPLGIIRARIGAIPQGGPSHLLRSLVAAGAGYRQPTLFP